MSNTIYDILMLLISVLRFFILAHFIMSWLINFDVLNRRQPMVMQVWNGLQQILNPLYAPIRRILPTFGGIDLTPLAALLLVSVVEIIVRNSFGMYH